MFRITTEAEIFDVSTSIELDEINVGPGFWNATFVVAGGPYAGWRFVGGNITAEFQRTTLTLQDPGFSNRPDKGYGYLVSGTIDGGILAGSGLGLEMSQSSIRPLENNTALEVRLANAVCQGDTIYDGVSGPTTSIDYKGRSTVILPGCIEIGIYPPGDPNAGDPLPPVRVVDTVGDLDLRGQHQLHPRPTSRRPSTPRSRPSTVNQFTIGDTLPPDPGYDAVVIAGGPIPASPEFFAGHNTVVGGDVTAPAISFTLKLGRGDGYL